MDKKHPPILNEFLDKEVTLDDLVDGLQFEELEQRESFAVSTDCGCSCSCDCTSCSCIVRW